MSRARDRADSSPTISGDLTVSGDLVPSTPLSHRNLIINGDFRINQRGKAARTTTSSAYNFDRWFWDGTYLYQGIEDVNVRNGTFTLGWTDSSSDITAGWILSTDTTAGDGPNSGLTYASISSGGQITVNEGTEYSKHLWIRFGGTVANLSKVQIEEGSSATPFEHRSYGDELARCQRYFEKHTISTGYAHICMGQATNSTSVLFTMPFLVEKRIIPTNLFSAVGGFTALAADGGNCGAASAISSVSASPSLMRGSLTVGSGLSGGNATALQNFGSAGLTNTVSIDAEL